MVILFNQKLKHVKLAFWHHLSPRCFLCAQCIWPQLCHVRWQVNAAQHSAEQDSSPLPPSPPAPLRACARRWGRAHARWRGVVLAPALSALWPQWQLRLTALRLPLRHIESALSLSLSLSPLSVSVSRPPLRVSPPSFSCLVSFHRSQPRSRRVEGSALTAQTAATPGRPLTNLPAPLLLPHGPASLRCCCCCRRRRRYRYHRRVEGDPDPTLFLRPDKNAQKAPHDEGRATFPLCFENRRGREGGEERRGGKKKFLTQSLRLKGGLSFTRTSKRLARRCRDTGHLWVFFFFFFIYYSRSRVQDHTDLCFCVYIFCKRRIAHTSCICMVSERDSLFAFTPVCSPGWFLLVKLALWCVWGLSVCSPTALAMCVCAAVTGKQLSARLQSA